MTITRQNSIGVTYVLTSINERETLVSTGSKQMTFPHSLNSLSQGWYDWMMKGMFIQEAFRFLAPAYREFLVTGITPEEWTEIFADTDEDN